jgi:hypothetical protein
MRFAAVQEGAPSEAESKGTRAIAAVERPRRPAAAAAATVTEAKTGGGTPGWVWTIVAVAVAAGAIFALKGRA